MNDYKKKQGKKIKGEIKRILLVELILFTCLCGIIYWTVQRIIVANANEYMEVSDRKLANELNYMYAKLENYAVAISGDERLQELLKVPIEDKAKHIEEVKNMMVRYKILEPSIEEMALISDNMYYSTLYHNEELEELCAQLNGDSYQWVGIKESSFTTLSKKQPMYVYGNNIIADGKNIGTLLISVKSSYFLDEQSSMPFIYALTDNVRDQFYMLREFGADDIAKKEWKRINKEFHLQKVAGYYMKSTYLDNMDGYLISINPQNKGFTNVNMTFLQIMIWSCIIIIMIFVVLFFLLINNRIVKPLQIFYDKIKEIRTKKQRHLDEQIELSGCLEIQEIGNEFGGMIEDIAELNEAIFENTTHLYEVELKKQDAELAYLRSQVDPHFLYNTLEVMRQQALVKGNVELAQIAVDMGNIFRYSSKGNTMVTLAEEISIIKSYVRIQESRFQGRLKVFYMIQEKFLKIKIMKMLIQPIIENAIFHGVEPKTEKGSIFVGARVENEDLIITVKDDGVGIPEKELMEIRDCLSEKTFDTSKHVGISNTQARIRLMYGEPYGIKIESSESDGTSVFIIVPIKEKERVYVPGVDC